MRIPERWPIGSRGALGGRLSASERPVLARRRKATGSRPGPAPTDHGRSSIPATLASTSPPPAASIFSQTALSASVFPNFLAIFAQKGLI